MLLFVLLVNVFALIINPQSIQANTDNSLLLNPLSSTIETDVIFSDDFNEGANDGWTEQKGAWDITDQEYHVVEEFNAITSVDDYNLTGCIIETKLRFEEEKIGYRAGIVFGYINSQNYYAFEIGSEYDEIDIIKYSSVNPEYGESRTFISPLHGNSTITIEQNVNYTLKIKIMGSQFIAFLNDQQVLTWIEDTYASGLVGLRARRADAFFDDFKVYTEMPINFENWIDTFIDYSKIDTMNNVTLSDGDIKLDTNPISAGDGATPDSDNFYCVNGWTDIDLTKPVSYDGTLTHWQVYGFTPGSAKLKIFRDNGTHYIFIGETSYESFVVGFNEFDCNFTVLDGDLIGIFVQSGNIDLKAPTIIGDAGREGDETSTLEKSDWGTYGDTLSIHASGYSYTQNGTLTSTTISPSSLKTWGNLTINKTETPESSIEVSVLDGSTNETISGFEVLQETFIDLSIINVTIHPTLRLQAKFNGTAFSTPVLHEWGVSWTLPSSVNAYYLGLHIQNSTGEPIADAAVSVDGFTVNETTSVSGDLFLVLNASEYVINASHPEYISTSTNINLIENKTIKLVLSTPYEFEGEIDDSRLIIEPVIGGYNISIRNSLELSQLDVFLNWEKLGKIPAGNEWQSFFFSQMPDLIVLAATKDSPDYPKAWYNYPQPLVLEPTTGTKGAFLAEPIPYAAGSIFVSPYPPVSGQPTILGVTLRNPRSDQVLEISRVDFQVTGFNAGGEKIGSVGYVSDITLQSSETRAISIVWNADATGHHCIRVILTYPDGTQDQLQKNIDLESNIIPGQRDRVDFTLRNPTHQTKDVILQVSTQGSENWELTFNINGVSNDMTAGGEIPLTLAPSATQQIQLEVYNENAEEDLVVDVKAYIDGELIGGLRKSASPDPPPIEPPPPEPDDFILDVSSEHFIYKEDNTPIAVSVASFGEFNSQVELSYSIKSGHERGSISCSFDDEVLTPSAGGSISTNFTVNPDLWLAGTWTLELIGTCGEITKTTEVKIHVNTFNLLFLLTKYSDTILPDLSSQKTLQDFQNIAEQINDYYMEASYGQVALNMYIYPEDGTRFQLPNDFLHYILMGKAGIDEFIHDTLDIIYERKQMDAEIDYTSFDNYVQNGKGTVILVDSIQNPNQLSALFIHAKDGRLGKTGTNGWLDKYGNDFEKKVDYTTIDVIYMPESANFGTWPHEIGHFLGKGLITSAYQTFKDYTWALPDLYGFSSSFGDVEGFGIMGYGHLSIPLIPNYDGYVHPCSFSKEWLDWLEYDEHKHPDFDSDNWINSLGTMDRADQIFVYNVSDVSLIEDNSYYILEVRSNNPTYSDWDIMAGPIEDYAGGLVIYKVDTIYIQSNLDRFPRRIINLARTNTDDLGYLVLNSDLDTWIDVPNNVNFTVLDERAINGNYEMQLEIKAAAVSNLRGAVLDSDANLLSLTEPISEVPSYSNASTPDLDLHAYTVDGRHVGMNYTSGEYEVEISGAYATGDLWNGEEWIFVPENENVSFTVCAKDNEVFFGDFPELWDISDGVDFFNLTMMYVDSDQQRWKSNRLTGQIDPGENKIYHYDLTENSDGSFNVTIIPEVDYELELFAGWNMVSFPALPDDPSFSSIFADVGFYQVLTWDGSSYVTPTAAEAGVGYWILVLEETTITIKNADPVTSYTKLLPAGWSMIGSIYEQTVNSDDVFPGFYQLLTWDGSSYVTSTTIEPGKGYWALVLEPTTIFVENQS